MLYLKEIFYVSTIALILFGAMELIHEGVILAYLNLNWVLLFWAFIGIFIIVINKENRKKNG